MVNAIKTFLARVVGMLKRLQNGSLDLLCKLIAAVGVLFVALEVCLAATSWIPDIFPILMPVMTLAFFGGFLLQGAILSAFKVKHEHDYSWEGATRYFELRYALPSLALVLVSSGFVKMLFYEYFRQLMLAGQLTSFDDYSLQPYLCMLAYVLMACAGIYVQFFPYERLLSFSNVLYLMAVSLLSMMLTSKTGLVAVGIFFAAFMCCAVIVLNQSYITRTFKTITVTRLTNKSRLYNMRMVMLALTITLVCGMVVLLAVYGVTFILRFLLILALMFIMRNGASEYRDAEEVGGEVFKQTFGEDKISGPFSVVMTLIMVTVGVVLLILMGSKYGRSLLASIKRWLDEFIAMFMGSEKYVPEVEINYKDEVEYVEKQRASRTERTLAKERLSYREFEQELNLLETDEEKLSYSYTVMIGLLAQLAPSLRPADTPRELAAKIGASMTLESIDDITNVIELIKYAEREIEPETSKSVLGEVCRVVQKRLE